MALKKTFMHQVAIKTQGEFLQLPINYNTNIYHYNIALGKIIKTLN